MEKAKITAIFGKSGSGKSYLTKEILSKYKGSFVIWDFIGEHTGGIIFDDLKPFLVYTKQQIRYKQKIRAILRLEEEYFDQVCFVVKEIGNMFFVIEEIEEVTINGKCPKNLASLLRFGRHKNVRILATSKRPAETPRLYTSQATMLIIFQIREPIDLSWLRKYAGIDIRKVQNLSIKHHQWMRKRF
ncbi:hypothetical protein KAW18_19310 [candidate division WOR-3 bacterium]|nr:hypothetical protein [candidate division WOR-3 bacterium]